jgi:sensor c-di-GMP phosphodiesterase-like protein
VLTGGSQGHVSINLSAADLSSHATVGRLQRLLEATRLPSECFWIEATERGFLGGDRARSVVAELRRMGFKVAIDDFGTGYSSLAVLNTFKLDILKIDKAFTASIGTGETKVIEHIIQLAKSLGLDLVAEGVETAEQAAFLHAQGVNWAQGWLFGRPVSPRDFQSAMPALARVGRYTGPITPSAI